MEKHLNLMEEIKNHSRSLKKIRYYIFSSSFMYILFVFGYARFYFSSLYFFSFFFPRKM